MQAESWSNTESINIYNFVLIYGQRTVEEVVVVEVVAVVIVAREKWYCKLNWMASAPSTQSARLHSLFPAALLHFSSACFVLPIRIEKTIYFYYYCCCQCKSKHTHTTRAIQQPDSISSTSTSSSSHNGGLFLAGTCRTEEHHLHVWRTIEQQQQLYCLYLNGHRGKKKERARKYEMLKWW